MFQGNRHLPVDKDQSVFQGSAPDFPSHRPMESAYKNLLSLKWISVVDLWVLGKEASQQKRPVLFPLCAGSWKLNEHFSQCGLELGISLCAWDPMTSLECQLASASWSSLFIVETLVSWFWNCFSGLWKSKLFATFRCILKFGGLEMEYSIYPTCASCVCERRVNFSAIGKFCAMRNVLPQDNSMLSFKNV